MKIWNTHCGVVLPVLSSPQSDNTGSIAPLLRDYIEQMEVHLAGRVEIRWIAQCHIAESFVR